MDRFTGLLGLVVILAVAWLLLHAHAAPSSPASSVWGLGLQFGFAFLVLKTDFGKVFQADRAVASTPCWVMPRKAASFVFGAAGRTNDPFGVVFAFQVLPIVIFIASFFAILYYLGVMQVFVQGHGGRRCRR